eukprot:43286_1
MAEQGPPIQKMYASQAVAYEAYEAYKPEQTDSTPKSPPKCIPSDLTKASILKWKAINELPANCPHCNVQLDSTCYDEFNGNVMIYCRIKNACGKSHVQFVQPDLNVPIYEQVCVFKEKQNKNVQTEEKDTNIVQVYGQQDAKIKKQKKQNINPMGQGIPMQQIPDMQQQQVFEQHASQLQMPMMQAINPLRNKQCENCNKLYSKHKHDYDNNGWRINGYKKQKLPKGWPIYIGKGKWKKK